MKPDTDTKLILANIRASLDECASHYLFEPIDSKTLTSMKKAFGEILDRLKETHCEEEVAQYIDLNVDSESRSIVYVYPKHDAPEWVFDLFDSLKL